MITTHDQLTATLKTSIDFEANRHALKKLNRYLIIAEKAYKKWLQWNDLYRIYDAEERRCAAWTFDNTKIKTAYKAECAFLAYIRCMRAYNQIKLEL